MDTRSIYNLLHCVCNVEASCTSDGMIEIEGLYTDPADWEVIDGYTDAMSGQRVDKFALVYDGMASFNAIIFPFVCSPDGLVGDDGLIEIKSTSPTRG